MTDVADRIGDVTRQRYEQQLVTRAKELIAQVARAQFSLGDMALEIEPMRSVGGSMPNGTEDLFTVTESLQMFADDIGVERRTVEDWRYTANRWPEGRRKEGVSFTVHRILASVADAEERWAAIEDVPFSPRTGARQWTPDGAKRVVRQRVDRPVTVDEKVQAVADPPWETVYGFFWRWNRAGVVTSIRDQLRRRIRTGKGRCPHPVILIVDSQSVKGASTVGKDSRGYDAAKKINGRKRHITVDALGLPVMITVTPADIQDGDAARDVFWRLRLTQPQITQVWADRGYAGDLVDWAREPLWLSSRIVSRPKGTKGFVVLPRRWKVERTIGWCMNARRNARDYERLPQHSEAHLNWALITMMTRRLTRESPRTSPWTRKTPATG